MMMIADGLGFEYRKNEPIISNLSREFSMGTMTGVSGRSGSGKSTLLYLLGLLLKPTAGRILIDGRDPIRHSDWWRSQLRARRIGFVFQDAVLDPTRTVLDNIIEVAVYSGLARGSAISRALDLMERFQVDLRPEQKPSEISGGQAQRVALCRALLNRPDIILADEPTGNLDGANATQVFELMLELNRESGTALVIVTHAPELAARMQAVYRLDAGRLVHA